MLLRMGAILLKPIPFWTRFRVLVAVGVTVVLRDLGVLTLELPQNKRLVPIEVLNRPEYAAAMQFGFEMGTGVRTYLNASAPYALAAFLLLAHTSGLDVLVAAVGFAAGRWAMLLAYLGSAGAAWRRAETTLRPTFRAALALLTGALVIEAALLRLAR